MVSFLSSFAQSFGIALQVLSCVLTSLINFISSLFVGVGLIATMIGWIPVFVAPFAFAFIGLSVMKVVIGR